MRLGDRHLVVHLHHHHRHVPHTTATRMVLVVRGRRGRHEPATLHAAPEAAEAPLMVAAVCGWREGRRWGLLLLLLLLHGLGRVGVGESSADTAAPLTLAKTEGRRGQQAPTHTSTSTSTPTRPHSLRPLEGGTAVVPVGQAVAATVTRAAAAL